MTLSSCVLFLFFSQGAPGIPGFPGLQGEPGPNGEKVTNTSLFITLISGHGYVQIVNINGPMYKVITLQINTAVSPLG